MTLENNGQQVRHIYLSNLTPNNFASADTTDGALPQRCHFCQCREGEQYMWWDEAMKPEIMTVQLEWFAKPINSFLVFHYKACWSCSTAMDLVSDDSIENLVVDSQFKPTSTIPMVGS